DYAASSLSSTQKAPTSALVVAGKAPAKSALRLDAEIQSTITPNCSNKGSPWNTATGARMEPSDSGVKYAEAVLYCQTNNDESPETLAGSMRMARSLMCDLEKGIGTIEYTAEGKVYTSVAITPTTECGWSAGQISEIGSSNVATLTATSYASGDWQKSIHLEVAAFSVDIKLYITATAEKAAIKFIEAWDADARGDGTDAGLSAGAKGTRGNVISIDRANGAIRAEYADTYWGRRARIYAKGSFDTTTGEFGTVTDMSGAFSDVGANASNGINGKYATVKGTSADGFKYNSGTLQQSGTTLSTGATFANAKDSCQPTTGCAGNAGITFSAVAEDLNFLSAGGALDAYHSTRAAFQTWLASAGDLTFTEFSKAASL
ncbi:MAG: hypothetical protein EBU49_07850, partial [Proteobacteria bacterium]|nr:hypothetical protein [Pseudomonadota bacterium]